MEQSLGSWAFILGVLVAVVGGAIGGWLTGAGPWITLLLVVLGLIVGFLNISQKEVNDFLIAAIALGTVGWIANLASIDTVIPVLGSVLQAIVANVVAFVAPAALVVALKAVWALASKPA